MRDPALRGKKRDLQRGLNGYGFSPRRHWNKLHRSRATKTNWVSLSHGVGFWSDCDCESWQECYNREDEFIRNWVKCNHWDSHGHHHAPADYRRDLNRQYRTRCKAELRRCFIEWDWDNFLPPTRAECADYSWF